MVEKKVLTLEEFRTATIALDGSVPLLFNGQKVHGILLDRNAAGDLQAHLQGDNLPDAPLVPVPEPVMAPEGHEPRDMAPDVDDTDTERLESLTERRKNDPASLTEEESIELAHLEKLAGVTEQRVADTGNEGDPL